MSDTTVEFSPAAAPLAERLLEPAREILASYPAGRERSALLPLLHLVQSVEGHVTPNGVAFCAEILGINKAQVGAVATFYTMYKRKPTGEYLVSVCTNTLCNVLGGQEVYDGLVENLGVGHEETTADGKITLEHAECLAACDYAPVVTVNYEFAIDQATPEAAVTMVEELRNGGRPAMSRGAPLCSLKETAIQLAGFADPREEALSDGPAGAPTLRGVTLAQEHGIAVAGFDPDTPLTRTKPAREGKPEKEGTVASVARKAAGAVKAAASSVAGVVENRKDRAGTSASGGDLKDPEVRTAEQRNATASEPDTDSASEAGLPTGEAVPENAAEAEGVAANAPAGDGKPAGDTGRGEDIVSAETGDGGRGTATDNPGWTGARGGNEEKK